MTEIPWERRGLDALLALHPSYQIHEAMVSGPWLCVDLASERGAIYWFAVWRITGCVYTVAEDGSVGDDPIIIPQGSPYTGDLAPLPKAEAH